MAISRAGRVELAIFSGRPNPHWMLTPEQQTKLLRMLQALPQTTQTRSLEQLGYHGFIVEIPSMEDGSTTRISLYKGIVQYHEQMGIEYRLDRGRQVEQWLLSTAKPWVDPELYTLAEQDLTR